MYEKLAGRNCISFNKMNRMKEVASTFNDGNFDGTCIEIWLIDQCFTTNDHLEPMR